jgi:hypothetical protein
MLIFLSGGCPAPDIVRLLCAFLAHSDPLCCARLFTFVYLHISVYLQALTGHLAAKKTD